MPPHFTSHWPCLLLLFRLCLLPCYAEDGDVADSPEVLPDHRVTFRLEAPNADTVMVRGVKRGEVPMVKDAHGLWTLTLGPVAPGLYGYSFIVDGESMLDPSNPEIKPERDPDESELEVLAKNPALTQWQNVPHGTIHLHDYFSTPLKRVRHLRVYTPPGYEQKHEQRYPVLILMHGTGDTEATWTEFGRAHYILDNLLAQEKARPMILIMPDGHGDLRDEEGIGQRNLAQLESDVLHAVLPMIDKAYRTLPDADHRAICGLSMGGFQSLFIGIRNVKSIAWVAGMSAYVPDAEMVCGTAMSDPDINSKLRLLWHQIGKDDYLLPEQRKFEAILENHHIQRQFKLTEGDHSWPVWRGYLEELLPLLFQPATRTAAAP